MTNPRERLLDILINSNDYNKNLVNLNEFVKIARDQNCSTVCNWLVERVEMLKEAIKNNDIIITENYCLIEMPHIVKLTINFKYQDNEPESLHIKLDFSTGEVIRG